MRKYFLNFFFVFYVTTSTSSDYVKSDFDERTAILDTLDHLFPNITTSKQLVDKKRELSDCYDCNNKNCICPKCVKCSAMSVCTALIGHLVEEVYYPDNLDYKETCKVLDELGTRTQSVIFGNGRTFRDTPQCRDMVMQYLCLFYGSNNDMYTNHCQDELSGVDPATHVYVPRPPCRSFCVQVATVCANSPNFIITCSEIKCPPTESSCTPDPLIGGQTLAANLGCSVPYAKNPYFKSDASKVHISVKLSIYLMLFLTILFLFSYNTI